MIHGDDHHIRQPRELSAVVLRAIAGAGGESAAVERNQHGALAAVVEGGSPDVERENVFAHAVAVVQIPLDQLPVVAGGRRNRLRRDLAVREAIANAGPRSRFLRRHVAILAAGRRAVRDAFEFLNSRVGHTLDFAVLRVGGEE